MRRLSSRRLEHHRDHGLLRLAQVAARRREEEILGELLRDRGPARHHASLLLVLLHRQLDAVPVEAFVVDELRILGGDQRALQVVGDPVVRHPRVRELRLGRLLVQLVHAIRHERRLAHRMAAPPQDVRGEPQVDRDHREQQRADGPQRTSAARRRGLRPSALRPQELEDAGRGRAHATPQHEALRRLLDQHAEAIGTARDALRARPSAGRRSARRRRSCRRQRRRARRCRRATASRQSA